MYAMVLTRCDITYAMTKGAQYSKLPQMSHWAAVEIILRYLRGILSYRITSSSSSHLNMIGYVDSNYIGDYNDRKSRTDIVFNMANGHVSWFSQKQGCTSEFPTEVEFVAPAEATKEAIWLRCLLRSLGVRENLTPLNCVL